MGLSSHRIGQPPQPWRQVGRQQPTLAVVSRSGIPGRRMQQGARGGRFATVCGVMVEGKHYRYKCRVEGAAPGGRGRTVLRYPDQTITLNWRGGRRVNVTFEGMKPQPLTYNTSEGTTQFIFEDKTYFYVSDRDAARMEVQNFRE